VEKKVGNSRARNPSRNIPPEDRMTDEPALDVLGIGNAIVDILANTTEELLAAEGLPKGSMTLIEAERADLIYAHMGPGIEVSGGSVANSTVGAASLGSRAAYIGKVREDEFGTIFAHDIRAAGVRFETPPATGGVPTARCFILVTPDAHRTMSTYLGACVELGPEDIDEDLVASAAVTYLEGYLWDKPRAKEAFRVAMAAAGRAGRRVALSLSDSFCVERHRDEFRALVDGPVDVLFANEHELLALYELDDLERAVATVRGRCEIALVTRSEHGSLVVTADDLIEVPAHPVTAVVDTTGAGDLYAAGFLHGLTHGMPHGESAALGALAAAEVISHFGARPEADLRALARDAALA
jgi:sugar/nucleoside kinase (ribokinase family)